MHFLRLLQKRIRYFYILKKFFVKSITLDSINLKNKKIIHYIILLSRNSIYR